MQGSRENRSGEPDDDALAASSPPPDPVAAGSARVGRLKRRAEFLQAARGRRAHTRSFSLQICKRSSSSDGVSEARFGLTVTKKVGGAVERNRIKRRLRAALRSPDLVPDIGHDYVIVARRDALTIPFSRLIADLRATLQQSRRGAPASLDGRTKPGRKTRDATEPIPPC